MRAVICLVIVLLATYCFAQKDCSGKTNDYPISNVEPQFVSKTTNGIRYLVKSGNSTGSTFFHLVHVYGTPYEMGKAYGELMKAELHEMITVYFAYLDKMIAEFIKPLPQSVAKLIADLGLKGALDATYLFTERHTPQRFTDELHGIADGSGVHWQDLRRLNLLPELTQAHCSIIGAWGDATNNRGLLQVRALDWDADAPISKFPSITVYHPTEAKSNAVANIGYVGLIGSITAFSNASVGLSEKVWINDRHNLTSRFGKPWTYVLRDAAQFGVDVDSVLNMFSNTARTAAIFVGVGDSVNQNFRGVQYSAKELNFFNWDNIYEDEYHPRLKDCVYWDKHVQPSHDHCMSSILQANHGKYTPEFLISQVLALAKTGNTQSAIFDFLSKNIYVAYNTYKQEPAFAYERQYIKLDMNKIFAVPRP